MTNDYALYAVFTILYKQERSMDEPKDFTYLSKGSWQAGLLWLKFRLKASENLCFRSNFRFIS